MKIALLAGALFVHIFIYSQTRLSAEVLGVNGAGVSFNAERLFNRNLNFSTGLQLGTGLALQGQANSYWLYRAGIHSYYKNWGLGMDASGFNRVEDLDPESLAENTFILYPSLHYHWPFKGGWFVKLSAGPAIAYQKVVNPNLQPQELDSNYWTTSPFLGIGIGKALKKQ
jgi:hypothetical protein